MVISKKVSATNIWGTVRFLRPYIVYHERKRNCFLLKYRYPEVSRKKRQVVMNQAQILI